MTLLGIGEDSVSIVYVGVFGTTRGFGMASDRVHIACQQCLSLWRAFELRSAHARARGVAPPVLSHPAPQAAAQQMIHATYHIIMVGAFTGHVTHESCDRGCCDELTEHSCGDSGPPALWLGLTQVSPAALPSRVLPWAPPRKWPLGW